jgi:hypothetical protein
VQLPRSRRFAAFPVSLTHWLFPDHVTPLEADKKEKTMTAIDFILLINALAQLLAAFAKSIRAIRHQR